MKKDHLKVVFQKGCSQKAALKIRAATLIM